MFGFPEDRRTPAERQRDLEAADKRHSNEMLALGFLKNNVLPLLQNAGANTGLVGRGTFGTAELLVEMDGVTYKVEARVNHDG
jgi:hypothetical protein